MRSPYLIAAAAALVGVAIGIIGNALSFDGGAYLVALLVGMLLVSLIDRDRFWGADLRRGGSRRHPRHS